MKNTLCRTLVVGAVLHFAIWTAIAGGQATSASSVVPNLISYNGLLKDEAGRVITTITGVTFLLYKDQEGGSPLWLETQNITPDKTGHYNAQLGATNAHGLPADLFQNGEARWLGIQIGSAPEQARVLMVAVPYAMKAADAETLGGLPASAFVLAAPVNSVAASAAGSDATTNPVEASLPSSNIAPPASSVTTSGGTVNTVPLFSTATNIQNSIITQAGTNAVSVVGKLNAPATGTATATAGRNSQAHAFTASAFNSGTSTAVAQTFQLQAEPVSNNTSTASGSLNLLFASGTTAPAETGFKIGSTGLLTFVKNQTFPGTGTITGVSTAAGSGLTGGGTSGTLSLKLLSTCSTNQILKWNGTAWACATDANSGTITGVTAGTDLTGGGTNGKVTLNLDTTKVPQLATANTFTQPQTINSNLIVSATSGTYVLNVNGSSTANGIYAQTAVPSSGGAAVFGDSTDNSYGGSAMGVAGSSLSTYGYGVYGVGTFSSSGGVYGLWGLNSSQSVIYAGVEGDSSFGNGVAGTSDSGAALYGEADSGPGVYARSNSNDGIDGVSITAVGVYGAGFGIAGSLGSFSSPSNTGIGWGEVGAWGDTGIAGGFGVLGTVDDGNALFGKSNSPNHETLYVENDAASSFSSTSFAARFAGSGSATWCEIYGNPDGSNTGELLCTGAKSAAVPVDGNRMVRLYAVEAADNWFEDAGGGQLTEGRAIVHLDPIFAQTINGDLDYRVFVTANGECEGLYVSSKTPQGFEVRELRGGRSAVTFDYRIMARRRGFEKVRLEDVTSHFTMAARNAQQREARVAARKAAAKNRPAPQILRRPKTGKPLFQIQRPVLSKSVPATAKTKTN